MSVLIIDDDEAVQDTVAVLLEEEGFSVAIAAAGRHGLDQALALKRDLILVDLRLPAVGGLEICQTLRAAGVETPISPHVIAAKRFIFRRPSATFLLASSRVPTGC